MSKQMIRLEASIKRLERAQESTTADYGECIQALVDEHQTHLATGHMSTSWQVRVRDEDGDWTWKDEFDWQKDDMHPLLQALKELDAKVSDFGIEPTNLMYFTPKPCKNSQTTQDAATLP